MIFLENCSLLVVFHIISSYNWEYEYKEIHLIGEKKVAKKRRYFDYSLLTIVIFLVCFGLVMLYSTSSYSAQIDFKGNSMYYVVRQGIFSIVGFALMLWVSKWDYHIFSKLAWLAYWGAFGLMALVRFTPLGVEINHARRWLRMPFNFTIQPSELAKIAVIVLIPCLICKVGKHFKNMKVLGKIFLWGAAIAGGVYILTDNLSTAIIVLGIVCVMIFVAHKKTAIWLALAGGGLTAIGIGVWLLDAVMDTSESFRLRRILVWLHPEEYLADGGFQVMQGLYAIGSGGFFGKGLGNSAQKMVIPEAQNDMILAVICEELGVFGAIVLLTMFGILLYRLMFIAQNAPDMYGSLMVTGIFAHIALQVVLNVAVVLNVIPTTGITLPFISYGGTSMVFLLAEMGIALSVSNRIEFDE